MEPARKRRRVDAGENITVADTVAEALSSLARPISPPRERSEVQLNVSRPDPQKKTAGPQPERQTIPSPFQLSWIQDLPPSVNMDALKLRDILGDPLITECWNFNYLHDIDFLLSAFDEDTRNLVKVHIVHGFWKYGDPHKVALDEMAARHTNVTNHSAYLPEPFGTHHSKMLILFRGDDTAQVVIHTANMIPQDWRNMTQAIWRSPLLPLLTTEMKPAAKPVLAYGTGDKFKVDLLNCLRAYDDKKVVCRPLIQELLKYDFSSIRAALIASTPGRHDIRGTRETRWGWDALSRALKTVPVQQGKSDVVIQVSSIATLGPTDKWIRETLRPALSSSLASSSSSKLPGLKIVFPTADEIRRSLDGYGSGGSIHTKIQSAQQQKQLQYLKPMFHHWANDTAGGKVLTSESVLREAGRKRAAPHIKTYVRFGEKSIDWALVTSANLSKQAWGETATADGKIRICSWEIGVLVWPALFGENVRMVGTFLTNTPEETGENAAGSVVGFRMPYNLPLQAYGRDEKPWCATASYDEPDWMGRTWT